MNSKVVSAPSNPEYSPVTRSSDGQNLLLANKLSNMRRDTPLRNRIVRADHHSAHKPAEIAKLKKEGERGEEAPRVVRKIHKPDVEADPIHRRFETTIGGKTAVVEYEPDSELRDTEQIPLQEAGWIDAFLEREVLPYAADAWYKPVASRSAMRSASRGTSTSRGRCSRWRRFGPILSRWNRRWSGCWGRLWVGQ